MKTFEDILAINVNDKTEVKGQFTYLSWAWAWAEFKKAYPSATYSIKKFEGLPYLRTNEGYMVFTEVTANEQTYEMWLPVMDFKNKAMKDADMMDINKAIMRCLVKNLAMFGLGLYIYAGEDLPEQEVIDKDNAKSNLQKLIKQHGADKVTPIARELGISSATITLEQVKQLEEELNKQIKE